MTKYVKQKDFYNEIVRSKEQGALTPEALKMLLRMIKEISKIFSYKNEDDRDDCQAFAMEDVLKYWDRFDPEKTTNAFSYFTQMIKNGFAKGWHKLHPVKTSLNVSISKENGIYNI